MSTSRGRDSSVLRAGLPRHHAGGFARMRVDPSAELLACLEANPLAELSSVGGAPSEGAGTRVRAFSVEPDASGSNLSCPHCHHDFSVAYVGRDWKLEDTRDFVARCPDCDGRVIVSVPESVPSAAIVVGPPRREPPSADILLRASALKAEDSSLHAAHAERMAVLERERDEWREKARTDFGSGALNDRAHTEDSEKPGQMHVALDVPTIAEVYERCGHVSGNRYVRDAACIMARVVKGEAALYRLWQGRFALITRDMETATRLERALGDTMSRAVSVIPTMPGDPPPAGRAAHIDEVLARHPKPYGLAVRMRFRE